VLETFHCCRDHRVLTAFEADNVNRMTCRLLGRFVLAVDDEAKGACLLALRTPHHGQSWLPHCTLQVCLLLCSCYWSNGWLWCCRTSQVWASVPSHRWVPRGVARQRACRAGWPHGRGAGPAVPTARSIWGRASILRGPAGQGAAMYRGAGHGGGSASSTCWEDVCSPWQRRGGPLAWGQWGTWWGTYRRRLQQAATAV